MSLIECCECGKKYSNSVRNCPECGCPTEITEKRKDWFDIYKDNVDVEGKNIIFNIYYDLKKFNPYFPIIIFVNNPYVYDEPFALVFEGYDEMPLFSSREYIISGKGFDGGDFIYCLHSTNGANTKEEYIKELNGAEEIIYPEIVGPELLDELDIKIERRRRKQKYDEEMIKLEQKRKAEMIAQEQQRKAQIKEQENKKNTYLICANHSVCFSKEMMFHTRMQVLFEKKADSNLEEFKYFLSRNVNSYDKLYNVGYNQFENVIMNTIDFGLEQLVKYGIYTYSVESLLNNFFNEFVIKKDSFQYLLRFLSYHEYIEIETEKFYSKKASQKPQSYWKGGGFGFKGALKGAAQAAILNVGTNAIVGIGHTISNAGSSVSLESKKTKIYNDSDAKACLVNALYFMSCDVGWFIYSLLVKHNVCKNAPFIEPDIIQTKSDNALLSYKKGIINKDKAIKILCNCIESYPFHAAPYLNICRIEKSAKGNIMKLAEEIYMKKILMAQMKQYGID